jgi:two-component system sensor histidine kinase TctE
MQRIDLRELCEVILENHLDAAAQKDIDLGLETVAAHATGHEWLLRELLSNLVDNAIKYTPNGGRVTLRCGWEKDGADGVPQSFLEVDDNGPGIAPQDRARVLDRFYRVPGVQSEGNGLGLAIAHEIALAHKSKLELQIGRGGSGLRVSLRLGP